MLLKKMSCLTKQYDKKYFLNLGCVHYIQNFKFSKKGGLIRESSVIA
jgi:hypothetical protein